MLLILGKRGYLRWERNLDEWFHYNNIQKKERLFYAIDQLKDDAFKWWVQEEDDRWFYKEPTIKTWRALKEVMRYEFAPGFTSSEIQELYPRRYPTHGSKEAKRMVPQQSHRSLIHQDQIRPNKRSTVLYDQYQPYEVPKAMEKKNFGVKTGPEVQEDTISTSLLRSKVVHDLIPRDKEILNPKKEGPSNQCLEEPREGEPSVVTHVVDQKMIQDTKQSILLKEAKPIIKVSHQGSKSESYMLTEVPRKEPNHKLSHEPTHKWKPKIELSVVQMPRLKV
ncbi:uncharacterized protein LOC106417349 [Brassica napus]|uniref:uncharacterized protein LOC106417349 n=1 Tax=Brassica napus TaxID=3708 RepID=UPI0006AB0A19|nr:uncharacterized protein LOC106417349 [Brassica napus]